VVVLVNDFYAFNIDSEVVIGVKDDVISLANGSSAARSARRAT
jgi:hypothetical protein